jgi:hypothetical protein
LMIRMRCGGPVNAIRSIQPSMNKREPTKRAKANF